MEANKMTITKEKRMRLQLQKREANKITITKGMPMRLQLQKGDQ